MWQRQREMCKNRPHQPPIIVIASLYHIDPPNKPSIIDMAHSNKLSRILIEQDSDPTLMNFKKEMHGLLLEDQVLLTDGRYMSDSRNRKRIIVKQDKLCRQYSNEVGEISHLQVLLPVQLLTHAKDPCMPQEANTRESPK